LFQSLDFGSGVSVVYTYIDFAEAVDSLLYVKLVIHRFKPMVSWWSASAVDTKFAGRSLSLHTSVCLILCSC